jgi:hypothetical protein
MSLAWNGVDLEDPDGHWSGFTLRGGDEWKPFPPRLTGTVPHEYRAELYDAIVEGAKANRLAGLSTHVITENGATRVTASQTRGMNQLSRWSASMPETVNLDFCCSRFIAGCPVSVVRAWAPNSGVQNVIGMTVEGDPDTVLIALTTRRGDASGGPTWDPDSTDDTNTTYAFTQYDEIVNTNGTTTDLEMEVWYLANPVASVGSNGGVNISGGDNQTWGLILLSGVTDAEHMVKVSDPTLGTSNMGNPGTISNDVTASADDMVLSIVGYTTQQSACDAPVGSAGQTVWSTRDGSGVQAGQDLLAGGMSYQQGAGTTTNSWSVTGALGGAMTQWDLVIQGCG